MRLAFLCPHSQVSGGVKVIFRLAEQLSKMSHQTVVVVMKHKNPTMAWAGSLPPIIPVIDGSLITNEYYKAFDAVVTYGDGPNLNEIPGRKILFLQGLGTQEMYVETKNLIYPYDLVIATSMWLKNALKKFGHRRTFIVPPGIDPIFQPIKIARNNTPVVGGLWHKSKQKNTDLFVNTITKIAEKDKKRLNPLLLSAGVYDRIKPFEKYCLPISWAINPPQNLLPTIYSSCDIWFSTSINEGFGLTPLEAMACGRPVVWVPNRGLDNYMLHGKNCLIVKDKQKSREAIMRILSDKQLAQKLILNGMKLAREFTWENAGKRFVEALETM